MPFSSAARMSVGGNKYDIAIHLIVQKSAALRDYWSGFLRAISGFQAVRKPSIRCWIRVAFAFP